MWSLGGPDRFQRRALAATWIWHSKSRSMAQGAAHCLGTGGVQHVPTLSSASRLLPATRTRPERIGRMACRTGGVAHYAMARSSRTAEPSPNSPLGDQSTVP